MQAQDIPFLSAAAIARAVRSKRVSPVEVTDAYLERIHRLNPSLHAYITVTDGLARAQARELERRLARGDASGVLLGVPMAVKDQFWTRGVRTTCGSSAYRDFVPDDDATVITRLREAGAVLLGKLSLAALALLDEERPPWGECRNAWDSARYSGGSSHGCGLALAAHLCAASVGEDTGGSGRNPASWSGVVGIRPTHGRVSRYGVMPVCWYLDTAAPMGKTVEDAALLLQAIAGLDLKDPYTSGRPVPDYATALGRSIKGVRVGVVQEFTTDKVDPDVLRLLADAVKVLRGLGATAQEVSIPALALGGAIYMNLAMVEGFAVHREVLARQHGLIRSPVRTWFWSRALLPQSAMAETLRARALLRQQVLEAFGRFDVLLSPTTRTPAILYAAQVNRGAMSEEMESRIAESLSYGAGYALAAVPAISVPCGFTSTEPPLPVGMQLAGPPFGEERLLCVAHAYEQTTSWHTRRAPGAQA